MNNGLVHETRAFELAAILSIIVCCQSFYAQAPCKAVETEIPIKVESFDWFLEKAFSPTQRPRSYAQSLPEGKSRNFPSADKPAIEQPDRFVYRLRLRNLSKRKITEIVWRYDLIDPLTNRLAGSRELISATNIKPGARKTVYAESFSPPVRTIDVKLYLRDRKHPYNESASVLSVTFAPSP